MQPPFWCWKSVEPHPIAGLSLPALQALSVIFPAFRFFSFHSFPLLLSILASCDLFPPHHLVIVPHLCPPKLFLMCLYQMVYRRCHCTTMLCTHLSYHVIMVLFPCVYSCSNTFLSRNASLALHVFVQWSPPSTCSHWSAASLAEGFSLLLLLAICGCRSFDVLHSSLFLVQRQTPLPSSPNSPPTSIYYLTHKQQHIHRPPDQELTSFTGFSRVCGPSIFHSSTWCPTGQRLCSGNQVQGRFCPWGATRASDSKVSSHVDWKKSADCIYSGKNAEPQSLEKDMKVNIILVYFFLSLPHSN